MKEYGKHIFGLKEDQETNEIIRERIASGAQVTGTNMYILICAILIASIGLNMDSTAVVIGAMLISPLMGVIISMAYGIASNDLQWIRTSGTKFLFQIAVSVITSTIYFSLSPIHRFSSELIARTQPTLWDVFIALFGGFAAIIANTRKNMISNVIPGAAIATALMPPLCTFGYCLSAGKWSSAFGAGYLFLINTIFICLASVIGFRGMRITSSQIVRTRKRYIILGTFLLICIVPSAILGAKSVSKIMMEEKFNAFIEQEFQFDETHVVKADLDPSHQTIEVMLVGSVLGDEEIETIESHMENYQLGAYHLDTIQAHMEQGVSKEELEALLGNGTGGTEPSLSKEKETELKKLLELQGNEKELQKTTIGELEALYPSIRSAGFTEWYSAEGKSEFSLVLLVEEPFSEETLENIGNYLEQKWSQPVRILQIPAETQETQDAETNPS